MANGDLLSEGCGEFRRWLVMLEVGLAVGQRLWWIWRLG